MKSMIRSLTRADGATRGTRSARVLPALLAGLILSVGGSPTRLAAQEIDSPYRFLERRAYFGAHGGHVSTNPGERDLGPQSGIAASGRIGTRFGYSPFGVDAGLTIFPTTRLVWDVPEEAGAAPVQVGEADLNIAVADVALRFDLTGPRTWRNLLPFLQFGGGFAAQLGTSRMPDEENEIATDALYDFGTRFAAQFGGGVGWFATPQLALRLDARNLLWQVGAPRAFVEREPGIPSRQWTQNLGLSVGLSYRY
jgi:hypothetical protein